MNFFQIITQTPQSRDKTPLNQEQALLRQVIPVLPSIPGLTTEAQSASTLTKAHTNAREAIESGDYSKISASNPMIGTLLKTLNDAGLSKQGQMQAVDMVFKLAETLSDPFSSENKPNDHNTINGLNPNSMSGEQALKIAAGVAAAIVAKSAETAREEQKRLQDLQNKMGSIPKDVLATVASEYPLETMTPDQIMAAVERELRSRHKDKNNQDVVTTT